MNEANIEPPLSHQWTARLVPGITGIAVSDVGEVFSCRVLGHKNKYAHWRSLGFGSRCNGYKAIRVSEKTTYVHRLVMLAFVGPCPAGQEVCHKNGNPFDNRLSNLRYGTHQSNCDDTVAHGRTTRGERNTSAKMTENNAKEVLELLRLGASQGDIARKFGVTPSMISHINRGHSWRHLREVQHQPCIR